MTTTIKVSNPAHATWRVEIEVFEGSDRVELITLDPHSEREVTIWKDRSVTVSEVPIETEKKDKADA